MTSFLNTARKFSLPEGFSFTPSRPKVSFSDRFVIPESKKPKPVPLPPAVDLGKKAAGVVADFVPIPGLGTITDVLFDLFGSGRDTSQLRRDTMPPWNRFEDNDFSAD